jgi:2-polyprenyl-3-methyl-5-hydroxy-6-metoxy-1,4-benzoquinol methylase
MKPGRNDPCPCGSGKKYKKCCNEKLTTQPALNLGSKIQESSPKHIAASPSPTRAELDQLNDLINAGRFAELESRLRSVLEIYPDSGIIWKMLGFALRQLDRENLQVLIKAATFLPYDSDAQYDLARLFYIQGNYKLALNSTIQSLLIKETAANKSAFVSCVKHMRFGTNIPFVKDNLVRALTGPWGKPDELAPTCVMLIKLDPVFQVCMSQVNKAWPKRLSPQHLFQHVDIAGIASNKLLLALMGVTPVCDLQLEGLLTTCRQFLLDTASVQNSSSVVSETVLDFYGVLARQCFINEYVFSQTGEEIQKASELRDSLVEALKQDVQVPLLWPLAVAAYFPLYTLPYTSRLLDRQWPGAIQEVLNQQIREPQQEAQERVNIPRLTNIEDDVSKLVQDQYEENPYPRWINIAVPGYAMSVDDKLRQLFPSAPFRPIGNPQTLEFLIAGCGTGYQSIGTAHRFLGSKILAIDLSMSSLSYAKRKTREMGVTSIEYAQADIMKLGSLERRFDVIESCGVLHHLADPRAGWRILLSLLRPGGFMRLGFYSELGRQDIVLMREFISRQGYGTSPDEVRRCRQDMLILTRDASFAGIFSTGDFYSTSGCRDLLFHVQEHRMNLPDLESFFMENELSFLGFEINPNLTHAYKQRFPNDASATNLGQWHIFETENPNIFKGMYNFWLQKAA